MISRVNTGVVPLLVVNLVSLKAACSSPRGKVDGDDVGQSTHRFPGYLCPIPAQCKVSSVAGRQKKYFVDVPASIASCTWNWKAMHKRFIIGKGKSGKADCPNRLSRLLFGTKPSKSELFAGGLLGGSCRKRMICCV